MTTNRLAIYDRVLEEVALDVIVDNPYQPRQKMRDRVIDNLATSIRTVGPIHIPNGRWKDGRLQLAEGHQRIAAHRLNREKHDGPDTVHILTAPFTDADMAATAIEENIEREGLTPLELAMATRKAIDEVFQSHAKMAAAVGKHKSTITNIVRILKAPDFIQERLATGEMSLSVARDFMILETCGHSHVEEMGAVLNEIVQDAVDTDSSPNFGRRRVRAGIARHTKLSRNFRPVGPKGKRTEWRPPSGSAGLRGVPLFDVEAFMSQHKQCLHQIPEPKSDDDTEYQNTYLWTCAVDAWDAQQDAVIASRSDEQIDAVGPFVPAESGTGHPTTQTHGGETKGDAIKRLFEDALDHDPVFQSIVRGRAKPGPRTPADEEEIARMGTRGSPYLRSFSTEFEKPVAQNPPPYDGASSFQWDRDSGGSMPPWIEDFEGCAERCVDGATYVHSGWSWEIPRLVCLNEECYRGKLRRGAEQNRIWAEDMVLRIDADDLDAACGLEQQLASLPEVLLRLLAHSILVANPVLSMHNAWGKFHRDWTFETAVSKRIRELLDLPPRSIADHDDWDTRNEGWIIPSDSIEKVADVHLPEIISLLMIDRLRGAEPRQDAGAPAEEQLAHA